MTGRQEINFSTDFPNVKLTHSNFLIFATTKTTEQPTNVPLVDKHPVQYIDQMASVSTHSQIVLSLLQGKRALLMGQYLLARNKDQIILLSNDNDETSDKSLLIDFVQKSFPANGGKYQGERISLIKMTRKGFQVKIESSAKRTWLPRKSVALFVSSPTLNRRSARLNRGSRMPVHLLAQLPIEAITNSAPAAEAPPQQPTTVDDDDVRDNANNNEEEEVSAEEESQPAEADNSTDDDVSFGAAGGDNELLFDDSDAFTNEASNDNSTDDAPVEENHNNETEEEQVEVSAEEESQSAEADNSTDDDVSFGAGGDIELSFDHAEAVNDSADDDDDDITTDKNDDGNIADTPRENDEVENEEKQPHQAAVESRASTKRKSSSNDENTAVNKKAKNEEARDEEDVDKSQSIQSTIEDPSVKDEEEQPPPHQAADGKRASTKRKASTQGGPVNKKIRVDDATTVSEDTPPAQSANRENVVENTLVKNEEEKQKRGTKRKATEEFDTPVNKKFRVDEESKPTAVDNATTNVPSPSNLPTKKMKRTVNQILSHPCDSNLSRFGPQIIRKFSLQCRQAAAGMKKAASSDNTLSASTAPRTSNSKSPQPQVSKNTSNLNFAPFKESQQVMYTNDKGSCVATITKVHFDDELHPFYTININGMEKQTVNAHLSELTQNANSTQPSAVSNNTDNKRNAQQNKSPQPRHLPSLLNNSSNDPRKLNREDKKAELKAIGVSLLNNNYSMHPDSLSDIVRQFELKTINSVWKAYHGSSGANDEFVPNRVKLHSKYQWVRRPTRSNPSLREINMIRSCTYYGRGWHFKEQSAPN